jgi:hypothetical protein
MGYALKLAGKVVPLTGLVPPDVLINGGRNTIIYEQDPAIRASIEQSPDLRNQIFKLFSTNHSPQSQVNTLRELLCCLPQVLAPKNLGYDNLFRDEPASSLEAADGMPLHIENRNGLSTTLFVAQVLRECSNIRGAQA